MRFLTSFWLVLLLGLLAWPHGLRVVADAAASETAGTRAVLVATSKCSSAKVKCTAKLARSLLKCEQRAETPGQNPDPNAGGCIDTASIKFNGGPVSSDGCFAKLESKIGNDCLPPLGNTPAVETLVVEAVTGLVESIDPPPLDQTKCGAGKKKCVSKLLVSMLKCHQKVGDSGPLADCLSLARFKFNGGPGPRNGCFFKLESNSGADCRPPLENTDLLEALAVDYATNVVREIAPNSVTTTSTTTTSSTSTSITTTSEPTTTTTLVSGCFRDVADGTIYDMCTGLQWEKKVATPGGLHSAVYEYSMYTWAGLCSVSGEFCQPNAEAAATCRAQADSGTLGCDECGAGEGLCDSVGAFGAPTTTIWDWLNQVNAEHFAGHSDWRIPSESGCNACWDGVTCSCSRNELETILLQNYPCETEPCIDPIFGPTGVFYLSSTHLWDDPTRRWAVNFYLGNLCNVWPLSQADHVRAVRGGS